MNIERFRQRLNAVEALIKPANSLAARLDALPDKQRAHYDQYSERMSAFIARCKADSTIDDCEPEARPYARVIEGYGPKLRADVDAALYGSTPTITATTTEYDAANIYRNACDDQRR